MAKAPPLMPIWLARGIGRRLRMLQHHGQEVFCPVCGHRFDRFKDDWNRPNALCWRTAMHELGRITAPGGWCLVMVPLDVGGERTYEDPTIFFPEERERAFWQDDHVRPYAPDIGDRLTAAGFAVERIR